MVCGGECEGNHNTVFCRTYRESCNDLQVTPNTGVLRLLHPSSFCVLRLRAISFKNFFLGDRGCDAIFEGLFPSIPHVELVNLSGTGMRTSAVEHMIHLFTNQEMPRLQSVDLSENPIPDIMFLPLLQWLVTNTSMFDLGAQGTLLTRDHQLVLMFQAVYNRRTKLGISGCKVARDRLLELYKQYPEAAVQSCADQEFPGDLSKWVATEKDVSPVGGSGEPAAKSEMDARISFVVQNWQQNRERLRRQRRNTTDPGSPLSSNRHHSRKQIAETAAKSISSRPVAKEVTKIEDHRRGTGGVTSITPGSVRGSSQRSRSEGAKEPWVDGLPIWARQMARQYPTLEKANKELQIRNNELQEQLNSLSGSKDMLVRQTELEQKVADQEAEIMKLKELLREKQVKKYEEVYQDDKTTKKNKSEEHRQSAEMYAQDIQAQLEARFCAETGPETSLTADLISVTSMETEAPEFVAREGSHVQMVRQLRDNAGKASAEYGCAEDGAAFAEDEETAAAALKIQSMQRGKKARKEVQEKKAQHTQQQVLEETIPEQTQEQELSVIAKAADALILGLDNGTLEEAIISSRPQSPAE